MSMITNPIDEEDELQESLEGIEYKEEEVDLERQLICVVD